jgi:hypothetical protein
MNAWEDHAFHEAIKKTGRKRLIFGALSTEICLAFPMVDALKEGHDVTFAVDAVGGMSQLAHRTAVERLAHAGAVSNTALALVTELFRDWKSPVADKAREIIKWFLTESSEADHRGSKESALRGRCTGSEWPPDHTLRSKDRVRRKRS